MTTSMTILLALAAAIAGILVVAALFARQPRS
jgi:hypothetical protein